MVSYNMYDAKSNVQGYVEAVGEISQSRCMRHITSERTNLCVELHTVCYQIIVSRVRVDHHLR